MTITEAVIELVLIWAMGHITGICTFMFIVWAAEKTGHRRDFYYNTESEDELESEDDSE